MPDSVVDAYEEIRKRREEIRKQEDRPATVELTEGVVEERNYDPYDGLCGFHYDIHEGVDHDDDGAWINFDPKYDYKAKYPITDEKILTYMDYMLDEDDRIISPYFVGVHKNNN